MTPGKRDIRSHLPMVAVTGVLIAATVLIAADYWRRGAVVIGIAALVAAAFRLLLPESRVGLLAVRGRTFDVGALMLIGVAIEILAYTISPLGTGG